MRKVKFRAKPQDPSAFGFEFVYGYYYEDMVGSVIYTFDHEVIPIIKGTLGEYTGLKGKNGKEIYEGDIDTKGRYIEYRDGVFHVVQSNKQTFDYLCHCKHIKVIGNVHENPELL